MQCRGKKGGQRVLPKNQARFATYGALVGNWEHRQTLPYRRG
jgi:hypothetical protein